VLLNSNFSQIKYNANLVEFILTRKNLIVKKQKVLIFFYYIYNL